jgi:glycerol-3-phosphate O-acyltransferase
MGTMLEAITLPIWLFVVLAALSTWSVLDRLLIPSVRWYLRRRVNRVIAEINTRLNIGIRPFQLTKRQVLIDRLIYDPKVMEALEAYAQENKLPRELAQVEVQHYAREIVPAFNAYIYFRLGYWLARRIANLLYRVRGGFADESHLAKVDPNAAVVFIMNHRSNMDYILVAFLAAEQSALSYAVGEWARIWPLQQLIRAMGAYFVRRRSNNPLYRRVLERYVHMATHEGVCQAVFLEGRLSRDGKLQPPRFGILDYMLRGHDPEDGRDIVFIPVGISYDRVLEDRTLLRSLDSGAARRGFWFVIGTTLGFVARNLWLMARNRWRRFGYAAVNFGEPVSVHEHCRQHEINLKRLASEQRFVEMEKLAAHLMAGVERAVPVLPIPLLAKILLDVGEKGIGLFDLKADFYRLADELRDRGAFVIPGSDGREQVFNSALKMLRLRYLATEAQGIYRAQPDSLDVLRYYANSIGR